MEKEDRIERGRSFQYTGLQGQDGKRRVTQAWKRRITRDGNRGKR
jgi:hypothetical protein